MKLSLDFKRALPVSRTRAVADKAAFRLLASRFVSSASATARLLSRAKDAETSLRYAHLTDVALIKLVVCRWLAGESVAAICRELLVLCLRMRRETFVVSYLGNLVMFLLQPVAAEDPSFLGLLDSAVQNRLLTRGFCEQLLRAKAVRDCETGCLM